jgi:hypothetical protein
MTQLRKVADGLRTRLPRAATVLEEAAEDILAYRHHAAWIKTVFSHGAPCLRRVERRLPTLSSRRGHNPTQERRWPGVGKRSTSAPISAISVCATNLLTPGMVESRSRVGSNERRRSQRPSTVPQSFFHRLNLRQVQTQEEPIVILDVTFERRLQLLRLRTQ